VAAAIAEHIARLRQRASDTEAEISRLQTSLEKMRMETDQQTAAAIDAKRQELQEEFSSRLDTVTQQRKSNYDQINR